MREMGCSQMEARGAPRRGRIEKNWVTRDGRKAGAEGLRGTGDFRWLLVVLEGGKKVRMGQVLACD